MVFLAEVQMKSSDFAGEDWINSFILREYISAQEEAFEEYLNILCVIYILLFFYA